MEETMRTALASLCAFLAVAAAACGSDGGSPPDNPDAANTPVLTYYKDVKPIVDAKCTMCHVDGGIAPFPLLQYGDFESLEGMIKEAVGTRLMPPWPPSAECNSYYADRSLTDEQIATITDWVDQGAVAGDPADEGLPLQVEQVSLSRVDVTLEMPEVYTAQLEPDDYRCFLLDWPETAESFVTGFRAVPGDARVVHHVIAFYIPPEDVPTYEQLDADEAGPGYTCFGGPGAGNQRTGWLGSWAPGSMGSDYPPGSGYRVAPGSKVALQVHYNTLHSGALPDQTRVEFKVDPSVDTVAYFLPWANPDWLMGTGMMIPANEADVMHAFSFDIAPYLGFVSDGEIPSGPFTIHAAGLHMHTLGTSISMRVNRGGGGETCLVDIRDWNFHWQGGYALREPVTVNPGDELYIECHWDNTAANQQVVDGVPLEPRDVHWGEGTTDEMCLGGLYITAAP
jgi:hypothetical protein